MADHDPYGESHYDIPGLCPGVAFHEKVMMTLIGTVITCTWVLFLVAVALDTKERVSYATATCIASVWEVFQLLYCLCCHSFNDL